MTIVISLSASYGDRRRKGPAARAGNAQRIRMLSGLPGRWVLTAVFTGFIDTLRVTVRDVTVAVWTGAAAGCAGECFAMTIWQAWLSSALCCTMQAIVRLRSGMVAEQTRNASFMQAC